jgi:hypothetical protein
MIHKFLVLVVLVVSAATLLNFRVIHVRGIDCPRTMRTRKSSRNKIVVLRKWCRQAVCDACNVLLLLFALDGRRCSVFKDQ